jgi:phosphoribosylformylglycinamidine synthase
MDFQVEVRITPRPGLLDPQGNAVANALRSLDFPGIGEVRVGRLIRLSVAADSAAVAREEADRMCRKLLANPVTEDYDIQVVQ